MTNLFVPTPRPAKFDADGRPWPTCPCGEYQATAPDWHGYRKCPCGSAIGEVCSVGSPRWQIHDMALIKERREARRERMESDLAARMAAETGAAGPGRTSMTYERFERPQPSEPVDLRLDPALAEVIALLGPPLLHDRQHFVRLPSGQFLLASGDSRWRSKEAL